MNIVDTRARNTFNFVKRKNIKNIPLFELSFLDHSIDISGYTDVIFQSTPSVEFFNHHKDLIDKNVFAMGPGTQSSLGTKGISSKIQRTCSIARRGRHEGSICLCSFVFVCVTICSVCF